MTTNQARAYAEIETANTDWLNRDYELESAIPEPTLRDTWTRETGEADSEAGGVIRLRLNLRDRQASGIGAADETGRKRGKRSPAPTEKDQTPPPRPRIVWRREDENETRPAPSIIME
jgi:hypothetical protein